MRQAVLLAGFAALAAASPAAQVIDFAAVNAAPSPSLTGPPSYITSQAVSINSASVAAEGSAAVTGVVSASATASQSANLNRRWFWWPMGWGQPSTTTTSKWGQPITSTVAPTTSSWVQTTSKLATSSSSKPTVTPTTTTSQGTTSITSSDSSCPTTPEPGTYCGFINPEDACAPQPDGYGPHVEPDTVDAFLAYPEFHQEAQAAKAPSGYVSTFVDLNASVSANTYLGLNTLQSYNVSLCGQYCDNKDLCTGFNIFVERDPSLNPSDNCTLPASITNYKCTLWGSGVDTASATNTGGYRGQFQVVITGSNGYEKTNTTTPPTQPGWQPPTQCGGDGGKAHNHPRTCMGTHFFPGPYNPAVCASYASAQNSQNKQSPLWAQWLSFWTGKNYNPHTCDFFNSYMLMKNGHPLGTYCALYSQSYGGGEATYAPGWQGSDFWSIESSWGWEITTSW